MKAKWLKKYKNFSCKLQFLSKLAAFLISIFLLLSLYDIYNFFRESPHYLNEFIEMNGLIPSIVFQLSIFLVFSLRFSLLFLKSEKIFWMNQLLWLIGLTLIASYWFYSRPESKISFAIVHGPEAFKHSSLAFELLGMWYLFFSLPLKLFTLVFAAIKSR